MNFLHKHKQNIIYGASLAGLLFLLRWLEFRFVIFDHALEVYIACIAIIFTGVGIWLALKLTNPKVQTIILEKEVYKSDAAFEINSQEIEKLRISGRELEVLQLMANGLSNQEIAMNLFLSLNTIKTHISNLFEKMDVKSRTQAIEKAKRLSLIP